MLRKLIVGFFTLCLLLSCVVPVYAQTPSPTPKQVILPSSAISNQDYFATGQLVDVEGTVNGDVYAAGGTVLINGTITGDVLVAGGQVTIRGSVHNIRVAGGQILIDGKVSGNITALGGDVTIDSNAQVAGSLVGAGGQFTVLSPIGKTVHLAAGQVTIGSTVGSDVTIIAGGQLTLTPTARINGNVWYQSNTSARLDTGSIIIGKLTHVLPPVPQKAEENKEVPVLALVGISVAGALYEFILALLVGGLLLGLVPKYSERAVEIIQKKPWMSLAVGLLAWLLTPLAVILLAFTVVGIPFIFVVLFCVVVLTYIGKVFIAVFLGKWIFSQTRMQAHWFWMLFVGLLVFELLSWIPIAGWIFACLAIAIGFGAVLSLKKHYYHELREKSLI